MNPLSRSGPVRPAPRPDLAVRVSLFLVLLLALPLASAQLATGPDPDRVADEAVRTWLDQDAIEIGTLLSRPPEEACRDLPALVGNPPPPSGTQVNLDDRQLRGDETEAVRSYTYPAELASGELDVVQVELTHEGDVWTATSVGFRTDGATGRPFLSEPLLWWAFVLLSVIAVFLLFRPSFLRTWVRQGLGLLRKHRGIFIGTMLLVYGAFGAGALTGSALPEVCADAVLAVLEGSLESAGATQAVASGNILYAAATIFYQNFVVVNVVLFFTLAVLFGVPAYLGAALVLFVNGIPFGLVGAFGPLQLLFIGVLIVLELTAHALVVTGGGILVRTIAKEGFGAFSDGIRRLMLMVPLAFFLLLLGAWYESVLIVPSL